jgi:hypothetical protein
MVRSIAGCAMFLILIQSRQRPDHGLLGVVEHQGNFIEMGVDVVRHLVKPAPLIAEFRRLVRGMQEIAILPLDVVHDTPAIEATVQTDRNESGLTGHESCAFCHQRERFILLTGFGFNDGDLSYQLPIGVDMWHATPRFLDRFLKGSLANNCIAERPLCAGRHDLADGR